MKIDINYNYRINGHDLHAATMALIDANQRIAAIKLIRATFGCGLKEAKDLVDRRLQPPLEPGTIVRSDTGQARYSILGHCTSSDGRLFYWMLPLHHAAAAEPVTFNATILRERAPLGWDQ